MILSQTMTATMSGLSIRASHVPCFAEVKIENNVDKYLTFKIKKIVVNENKIIKIKNST